MIYEYALDPELISKWASNRRDYSDFVTAFGIGTTRIPSVVRKFSKWRSTILKNMPPDISEIKAKRIESLLEAIGETHIKRSGANYNGELSWYENVIKEHERIPFDFVFVVDKQKCQTNRTIIQDDLYSDVNEKNINNILEHPTQKLIMRTASEMSQSVQNMLRLSSHIIFIDPYLKSSSNKDEKDKKLGVIKEFIEASLIMRLSESPIEIELMFSSEKTKKLNSAKYLYEELIDYIGDSANFINLTVKAILEISDQEKFHNRYILTELGGVKLGIGLDQSKDSHTDELDLLNKKTYLDRWNKYVQNLNFKLDEIYPSI